MGREIGFQVLLVDSPIQSGVGGSGHHFDVHPTPSTKSSPALKEILLKLYSADKPLEIDHHFYEFGSVQYHVQASASESHLVYLSVSTSLQSPGGPATDGFRNHTSETLKRVYSDVIELMEYPKEGFQLTIMIKFSRLPQRKDECHKIITDISSLQSVILSSQMKELLGHLGSQYSLDKLNNPVKLVYHPGEPFFVIRLPEKIIVIFPMRFKEDSDVLIAETLFQKLMEMQRSRKFTKAPPCDWSPIPPPELRGELFEDLSTNGGFVSFDIFSRHTEGSMLDKTVWNLLNFYAYVKHHVKCTRGFIQRRMRKKVENMSEKLKMVTSNKDLHITRKKRGHGYMKKLARISRSKIFRGKWATLVKKIRSRLKIKGLRRKWLNFSKFYSSRGYTKLN